VSLAVLGGLVVAVCVLTYVYGIPMLAQAVANRIPYSATEGLSAEMLASLDKRMFTPTALAPERRAALEAAFSTLTLPPGAGKYRLVFRKSDAIGANAIALPSGTIVVTDALVTLAKDDREVVGVLAHEAGHVDRRHGLRSILQNSLMGLVIAMVAGDLSSLAAAAPAALLEANYSRELEREADAYAVQVLRQNGIPVQHLANMLRRLDESSGTAQMAGALTYLSSHPATSERLAALDAASGPR
jgi:Zn-dependent protease with chaperone function